MVLAWGSETSVFNSVEKRMNEDRAIKSHRKAIREHIDKYNSYTADQEKQFALKTIRNAQQQIADIKTKKRFPDEWEDTWGP